MIYHLDFAPQFQRNIMLIVCKANWNHFDSHHQFLRPAAVTRHDRMALLLERMLTIA